MGCFFQHENATSEVRMLTKLLAKGTTAKLCIRVESKRSHKDELRSLGASTHCRILYICIDCMGTHGYGIWEYIREAIGIFLKRTD